MVRNTGLSGRSCFGALVAGRSTGTSTVASGAAIMKMISSTRITSMNGVTLISWVSAKSSPSCPRRIATGLLRRGPRNVRRGDALAIAADQAHHQRRAVREQRAIAADRAREHVVDHDRRNRGEQTERGREQRLSDPRRNDGKIGGVGIGDADEAVHDA